MQTSRDMTRTQTLLRARPAASGRPATAGHGAACGAGTQLPRACHTHTDPPEHASTARSGLATHVTHVTPPHAALIPAPNALVGSS